MEDILSPAMRYSRISSILLAAFVITTASSAQPQPKSEQKLPPQTSDCSGNDKCGLPGIPSSELLCSMNLAMTDLSDDKVGFPVGIVAASYGLREEGRRFSLGRWHTSVSKMEKILSDIKLRMLDPSDAPALVPFDLPTIGPHIYDADLIRALVSTDLFPYPMRIVAKSRAGFKVSYVLLNASIANPLRAFLPESCRAKPLHSKKQSVQSTVFQHLKDKRRKSVFSLASFPPNLIPDDSQQNSTNSKAVDVSKFADLLKIADTQEFIQIKSPPCEPWNQISPDAHPVPHWPNNLNGCEFRSVLRIPRRTAAAYSKLEVVANILSPKDVFVACGPGSLRLPGGVEIKVADQVLKNPATCESPFRWELSGPILQSSNQQPLEIAVESKPRDQSAQGKTVTSGGSEDQKTTSMKRTESTIPAEVFKIEFTINGTAKPWWRDWWNQHMNNSQDSGNSAKWCVPGSC